MGRYAVRRGLIVWRRHSSTRCSDSVRDGPARFPRLALAITLGHRRPLGPLDSDGGLATLRTMGLLGLFVNLEVAVEGI